MFSRNLKHLILILVFPVAGVGILTALPNEKTVAQIPAAIDPNPGTAQTSPKAKVKFKKPKLVKDVVDLAAKNKIKLEQLDSELVVGNKPIYGIYNVSPRSKEPSFTAKTATEIESYINKERLAFFADMVAGEGNLSAEERLEFKSQLEAMKAALKNRDTGSISVTQATFSGDVLNLKQLSQDVDVEKADIEDKEFIKKETQKPRLRRSEKSSFNQAVNFLRVPRLVASLNPASVFAQATVSWYPNSGRSEIGQSANAVGERYTKQYMKWTGNAFFADETYEHEFYLDANDGMTYLSTAQSDYPDCMPETTSIQSTWGTAAAPYLDTRLEEPGSGWCEAGRIGYVIGAGKASEISSGVTHYNYIRARNGNASSDRFILTGQIGYRYPDNCMTTWCSYGYSDFPKAALSGDWSVNVPGVKDWIAP